MEFVGMNVAGARATLIPGVIGARLQDHITPPLRLAVHHHAGGDDIAQGPGGTRLHQVPGQVHQAAALGVARQALADGLADIPQQGLVGRQGLDLGFREAAADEESVDIGG